MGNLVKMDMRRLFISKSFYISMAIVAAINILLGMIEPIIVKVFAPNTAMDPEDLSDLIISPFTIPLLLVVLLVSMVNFSYADISNGYIKNIAGQIPRKSYTIISKYIVVGIHNIVFLLVGSLGTILGVLFGGLLGGHKIVFDSQILSGCATLLLKWLLLMAMSAILMFVTMGIKSKNLASIVGVFLGTGALALVYLGLNTGISNIFKTDINISNYVPDQLFGSVDVASGLYVFNAVNVSLVCIVMFMALTIKVFNSRDIK